jgi:hypothetical protein
LFSLTVIYFQTDYKILFEGATLARIEPPSIFKPRKSQRTFLDPLGFSNLGINLKGGTPRSNFDPESSDPLDYWAVKKYRFFIK